MKHLNKVNLELNIYIAAAKKSWTVLKRYPLMLMFWSVFPLLYTLNYLFLSKLYSGKEFKYASSLTGIEDPNSIVSFILIGVMFWHLLIDIFFTCTHDIRREQFWGTFESNFVAPVTYIKVLIGKLLFSAIMEFFIISFNLFILSFFYKITFTGSVLIAVFIVFFSLLGFFSISLISSGLVILYKEVRIILNSLVDVFFMLSGVTYKTTVLPAALKVVAIIIPLTWSIDLFRKNAFNLKIENIYMKLGIFSCSSVLAFLIAIFIFNKMVKKAKREGKLSNY